MSSCIILQQRDSIFMASDTAISTSLKGRTARLSNLGEKLFCKDDKIVFCSGNMKKANLCKKYIEQNNNLKIKDICKFANSLNLKGSLELFIAVTEKKKVKSYQISSYNNFIPIEREVDDDRTEIYSMGFNTINMLNSFEENLLKLNVLSAIEKTFNDNIIPEVGGNVSIAYFHNGEKHIMNKRLKDNTPCLLSKFEEYMCSFVMAETLIGKVILGAKLEIGNEDNTFVINPHGMSVYDSASSQSERIFIGIENGQATFRLMSKDGSNKLVLSEDGIYQVFPVQARDSFDNQNSFKISFYLPSSLQRLDEARLIFNLEKFRAYSKGASTSDQIVDSFTSSTMDGYVATAKNGGSYSKATSTRFGGDYQVLETSDYDGGYSSSSTSYDGGYKYMNPTTSTKIIATSRTTRPDDSANNDQGNIDMPTHTHAVMIPNHDHKVEFTIPNHRHTFEVAVPKHRHTVRASIPSHDHEFTLSIPDHEHKVDISKHSHVVEVTIPSHSHEITHGIYEYPKLAKCELYIDGELVADNVAGDRNINIMPYLSKPYGGTHTFEVRSKSTAINPNGLGRANVAIFIAGFVSF